MSLRREYSPSLHYPDSSVKDLNLAKWNELLETLSIGEGTELELRGTPTHKLLERLHPILTNQDRGVSLEYDLQNKPELYNVCNALINEYRDKVGRQSSVYLARTVRLGNKTGTIDLNNPDAVYLRDFVADFTGMLSRVRSLIYVPVVQEEGYAERSRQLNERMVADCNAAETLFSEKISALSYYPAEGIVNAWRGLLIGVIGEKLITAVRTVKASEVAADLTGTELFESAVALLTDYLNGSFTSISSQATLKIVTIRLYPTYSGIAYVCPQPVTTQLSHSRFIQSKTPAQNIRVTLQNNIALNTLDTQWYGFYTELFSNIIEYGNPAFTLRAGHDRIEKCYLTEPLTFAKRNDDPMQTFTLGIISSSTGINVSDSGS